jgi:hypothetical protein
MATSRIHIPSTIGADCTACRRRKFTSQETEKRIRLANEARKEGLKARYLRRENLRPRRDLGAEARRAEDPIRLGTLLLAGLAKQENALLDEEQQSIGSKPELWVRLNKRKMETVEALGSFL